MDPIADMLVRIKNGLRTKRESVELPHSVIKEQIARILLAEGFISKWDVMTRLKKKFLRVVLKYSADKSAVIGGLKRISRPGCRIYRGANKIPRVESGYGVAIISTAKGLMTDSEAREKKLGGEVICYIW